MPDSFQPPVRLEHPCCIKKQRLSLKLDKLSHAHPRPPISFGSCRTKDPHHRRCDPIGTLFRPIIVQ